MSNICTICQHQFTRPYDLKRHIETVHNEERNKSKRYECPICHKTYNKKSYIKKHCQIVHRKQVGPLPIPTPPQIPSSISTSIPPQIPTSISTSIPSQIPTSIPIPTSNAIPTSIVTAMPITSLTVEQFTGYLKERDEVLKQEIQQIKTSLDARDEALKKEVTETLDARVEQKIQQIKPSSNVLQVVCIGSNDNYFKMLTETMGDVEPAIEYIKQCALSEISGDSSLLEKVYQVA